MSRLRAARFTFQKRCLKSNTYKILSEVAQTNSNTRNVCGMLPAMATPRLAVLQNTPIFGGVRADVLQFILDMSPVVSVPKGKFFFREHDSANSMYVLERGEVAVLKAWKDREYALHHLHVGDCFGEMSLIDLQPRSASLLATEDSSGIEISSAALFQVYEKDLPQLALIYMNMGREVSRRLRATDESLFQAKIEAVVIGDDYVFRSA